MGRLIYAASEQDADLFYATRFFAPDPFLYFEKAGRRYVVLSQLEYDRGRRETHVDKVINQSVFVKEMHQRKRTRIAPHDWIVELLRRYRLTKAQVLPSFPLGLARALQKKGIRLTVARHGLFPERAFKSRTELLAIRKSLRITAQLLQHGIEMIRFSRVGRNGVLILHGSPLTSERVQAAIRMEAARQGFEASHPIVAGGVQACDPHECGHGKLKAKELIILDIFPRDLATGYWGDMTRTVVKGRANEAQRRQFEIVRQAQKIVFAKLHDGINGRTVHHAIEKFFEEKGYRTGNASGRYEGFFHGTGHGLGLEIHEAPGVNSLSQHLRAGHVVTVEPGLYYPKIGGVRIEDVVVIRQNRCEKLSNFPVYLEI